MGDGRYYTLGQFFSIIYLTTITIFIVYYTVLNIYKASGNQLVKKIMIPNIILFLIVLLNFFEQIIIKEQSAFQLKLIACVLFIIMNVLLINFILNFMTTNIFYRKLSIIFNILMCLFIFFSFFNNEFFIKRYHFNQTTYGNTYLILLVICFFMYLYLVYLLIKSNNKQFFYKRQVALTLIFFLILPIGVYIATIFFHLFILKIIEYMVFLMIAIGYRIALSLSTPYRVSSSIFNNVQGLILDYVFITDEKGTLIYKNQDVLQSNIFKDTNLINISNISTLFNKEIELRKAYNKQFIKYINGKAMYFQYSKKEIIKGKKLAGYILTFTDITTLIKMLDELKLKQKSLENIHKQLTQYKDIVYELEKAKEINALLSDISNNQQKTMLELKESINQLKGNIDNHFIEKLSIIIDNAKYNLNDVRAAVTAYMNYYDT